jgi:hypothetical protein
VDTRSIKDGPQGTTPKKSSRRTDKLEEMDELDTLASHQLRQQARKLFIKINHPDPENV